MPPPLSAGEEILDLLKPERRGMSEGCRLGEVEEHFLLRDLVRD